LNWSNPGGSKPGGGKGCGDFFSEFPDFAGSFRSFFGLLLLEVEYNLPSATRGDSDVGFHSSVRWGMNGGRAVKTGFDALASNRFRRSMATVTGGNQCRRRVDSTAEKSTLCSAVGTV
jgi:hypothetical protein